MGATLGALLALACCGTAAARSVIDMAGRSVELPAQVRRVACLEVLCYPRVFMLGAEARIGLMYDTAAPWMVATNPQVRSIPRMVGEPNVEELLARGIDTAFVFYDAGRVVPKLATVGIAALVSQPVGPPPATAEAFIADTMRAVRLFGQVLGGEAEARAEEWCRIFETRIRRVLARTADIPAAQRPRLYYVRGPQAVNTQGRGSYTYWSGTIAGASMIAGALPLAGRGSMAMEDILRWDPQVVLVGRQYPLALVQGDPRWADVTAVREGRVLSTPEGVFYWDGGPESALLLTEFIARLLYPDRFPDLDMRAEVQEYYARFYRTRLDDAAVGRLLRGEAPDGSRHNPFNN
ncbi:ABC transporter substrate-binding protein [Rhodovastum atsumiense]|nr:ABC transporter substrate-binding protein [Rhodovastum atsumiense]CAH2598886.1 ABC transporter substrate-binding protein [Rhodovastum atsumiense]